MAEQPAKRDSNFVTTLIGVDNIGFTLPTTIAVDPTTHAMLITGTITASPASDGATGAAVPASASYEGINVAGTLRGATGVNPSGTVYATQIDLASVGGATFALNQQLAAASLPVVLTATQVSTLTPLSSVTVTQGTGTNLHMVVDSGTVTTVSTVTSLTQLNGVNISLNAGVVDTGTQRVVQPNGAGKTIVSAGGSAASSGNNTLVAAGTNKLKVFAFSLSTASTTAMTCIFQSGASGTELWRVLLQAGTSVSTGANLTVSPPAWLFATASATLLNLNLSSANAVHWSVSYFDEA